MTISSCKFCGSTDVTTVPCAPPSPHHAEARCRACRRHLGWIAGPMTPGRAAGFVMPYGAFRGQSLAAIGATPRGREYLRWLSTTTGLKPTMYRAIAVHLEAIGALEPLNPPNHSQEDHSS